MAPSRSNVPRIHSLWVIGVPLVSLGLSAYWFWGTFSPFWHYLVLAGVSGGIYLWLAYAQGKPNDPLRNWGLLGVGSLVLFLLSFFSYPGGWEKVGFGTLLLFHGGLSWILQYHLRSRWALLKKIRYIGESKLRELLHNEDPSLGFTPDRKRVLIQVVLISYLLPIAVFWLMKKSSFDASGGDTALLSLLSVWTFVVLGRFSAYDQEMRKLQQGFRTPRRSRVSLNLSQGLLILLSLALSFQLVNLFAPTESPSVFNFSTLTPVSSLPLIEPSPPPKEEVTSTEGGEAPELPYFLTVLFWLLGGFFNFVEILLRAALFLFPYAVVILFLFTLVKRLRLRGWKWRTSFLRFLSWLRNLLRRRRPDAEDPDAVFPLTDEAASPPSRATAKMKAKVRQRWYSRTLKVYKDLLAWMSRHRIPVDQTLTPREQLEILSLHLDPSQSGEGLGELAGAVSLGLYGPSDLGDFDFEKMKSQARDLKKRRVILP